MKLRNPLLAAFLLAFLAGGCMEGDLTSPVDTASEVTTEGAVIAASKHKNNPGGPRETVLAYNSGPGNPVGFGGWHYTAGGPDVGMGFERVDFPQTGNETFIHNQMLANGLVKMPFWYNDPQTPCRDAGGNLPQDPTMYGPATDLIVRGYVTLPPGSLNVQVHASFDDFLEIFWEGVKVSGGTFVTGGRVWETMTPATNNGDGTFRCFHEDMVTSNVPNSLAAVPSSATEGRTFLVAFRVRDAGYEAYLNARISVERGFVPDPEEPGDPDDPGNGDNGDDPGNGDNGDDPGNGAVVHADWFYKDPGDNAPINITGVLASSGNSGNPGKGKGNGNGTGNNDSCSSDHPGNGKGKGKGGGNTDDCDDGNAGGVLPVTVLGNAQVDLTQVDPATIRIYGGNEHGTAPTATGGPLAQVVDRNNDGHPDLMMHFPLRDMILNGGLNTSVTELCLKGDLPGGGRFGSCIPVRVIQGGPPGAE